MKIIYLLGLVGLTKSRLSIAVYTVLKGSFPATWSTGFSFPAI